MLKELIISDLLKHRYKVSFKTFMSALLKSDDFKMVFLLRLEHHFRIKGMKTPFSIIRFIRRRASRKRCILIGSHYEIGKGFSLGHCFSITVDAKSIGDNVKIMQQVTIGRSLGGKRVGIPTIGNNVFVAAGAKIIGNVHIGDNVIVGSNAVVVKDIPDNSIVGGYQRVF